MASPLRCVARWARTSVREWKLSLLAVVAIGLFVAHCIGIGDVTIDDAFITFSFSKNLALGNGPLFSHGVRAEGYSTFLWMVLVAVPLVFTRGAAPLAMARVMGAPFVALLGWSTYRLARACGASRRMAAACVLLLSFNTDLVVGYLTGMETLPYVALVAFAFSATVQSFTDERWQKWAVWGGLAVALMRIDGFVPWGMLLGWSFLLAIGKSDRKALWRLVRTVAPAIAVYAVWFLWRWNYYGLFLPSTYYAKALLPKLLPNNGFEYVTAEVVEGALWCGLLGWLWLLWRRRLGAALLGCYVIVHWLYVVQVGGDWMPFGRFMLATVPLLLVLLCAAASDLVGALFRARHRLRWILWLLPVPLFGLTVIRMDHRFVNSGFENNKLYGIADQTANVRSYLRAAVFLNQVVPAGARLVSDYGGVFGCYTDASIIEMWGLANPIIATRGNAEGVRPNYGRTCAACYPELKPEYFHVMVPMVRKEPAFKSADDVIANVWQSENIGRYIDFKADFAVGRVVQPKTGEALYFLRKRDGSKLASTTTERGFTIDYPFESQRPQ